MLILLIGSFTATELTNNIFGTDDDYDYEYDYEDEDCEDGYYHNEPESDDDMGTLTSGDHKINVETPKKPCFTIDVQNCFKILLIFLRLKTTCVQFAWTIVTIWFL